MKKLFILPVALLGLSLLTGCGASTTPVSTPVPSPVVSTPVVPTVVPPLATVGAAVLANASGDTWNSGTVTASTSDSITVKLDGSTTLGSVFTGDKVALKPLGPQAVKVGDVVVAKWTDSSWWLATVTKVDGSKVEVRYSDNTNGDDLTNADITRPIKGKLPTPPPAPSVTAAPSSAAVSSAPVSAAPSKEPVATAEEPFPVGMTILGQWNNGQAWYPGKVAAKNGSLYDVNYNDGTSEKGLTQSRLAHFPGGAQDVKVGDAVIAEWQPATWWSATVKKVNGTTGDIEYSDKTTGSLHNTQFTRPGK